MTGTNNPILDLEEEILIYLSDLPGLVDQPLPLQRDLEASFIQCLAFGLTCWILITSITNMRCMENRIFWRNSGQDAIWMTSKLLPCFGFKFNIGSICFVYLAVGSFVVSFFRKYFKFCINTSSMQLCYVNLNHPITIK